MFFTELLRVTVLFLAALATFSVAVSVAAYDSSEDETAAVVAAVWWSIALVGGAVAGARRSEALRLLLSEARTELTLPDTRPIGIAVRRLWPLGLFAVAVGGLGLLGPEIPVISAGFAIFWALAWRRHEAAVVGVEDRDGVRFFVRPTPAHRPLELVRAPGFGGERKATLGDAPVPKSP